MLTLWFAFSFPNKYTLNKLYTHTSNIVTASLDTLGTQWIATYNTFMATNANANPTNGMQWFGQV